MWNRIYKCGTELKYVEQSQYMWNRYDICCTRGDIRGTEFIYVEERLYICGTELIYAEQVS